MSERVHESVACVYCGCLCDDLRVTVRDNRIVRVERACALGASKLMNYRTDRLKRPLVRRGGRLVETGVDEAIDRAASVLSEAKYPLLYGWSSTSNEAIAAGLELAEEVGGVYDNTATVCHGPTILADHDIGHSSSTLGEIKNRADLVVYWGCNPAEAHPRHAARYTVMARGFFRPSRKDRTLIVVDVRETATARMADRFIRVDPGSDFEVLTALRVLSMQGELEGPDEVGGVPVGELEEMAEMMIGCEFGAILFGLGLTMSRGTYRNIDAALSLVRDLNRRTKFVIMPMRGHFNVTGANTVSTWETGYPYAVDFSLGYPQYNPGDTSAVDILARGCNDATLVVAADPVSSFPAPAVRHMLRKPLVVIDPHRSPTTMAADVVIPSALVGIEAGGTAYRMDVVPLPLKKLVDPPEGVLSDEEILRRILGRVKERRRKG
ncbi:TPA: formylmethanofuran dehydrogenase subunit B [Candidatus Bathyarchaeota archaeon]|nr:formylmethanofuran dehydrogenase subunit B [Candidatus Bathyarchaeota archaeon]